MNRSPADFSVFTFDCYGTLIDWETGIWEALQPLLHANQRHDIARPRALAAFARLEAAQEEANPELPYELILERVHALLARELDLSSDSLADRTFGASVPHWPAFADSAQALRDLARRHRLVILSNVSERGIAASIAKLGVSFDAVYTAERIGSYKPDPANFRYLLEHLALDLEAQSDDVLHVAQSLFHDHVPARAAGLATAWIDRQQLSKGGDWGATAVVETPPDPDFLFYTMGELAAAALGSSNFSTR